MAQKNQTGAALEDAPGYAALGVSSGKQEVHNAIKKLDKGLYPNAFCKVFKSAHDPVFCMLSHSDGAGTKTVLAYAYWKLTGDLSVWKGIAQDAFVMNLDDVICVGVTTAPMLYTLSIDVNAGLVPDEVVTAIIDGTQEIIDLMNQLGFNITFAGGETAQVPDLVRTIVVNGTLTVPMVESYMIMSPNIMVGDVVVGLSSTGQASYETSYNSGIGSNGITSARHNLFRKGMREQWPETVDPNIKESLTYRGPYWLTQNIQVKDIKKEMPMGKFVLSPTRTYAPVIAELLKNTIPRSEIHAIIHCSGGGQTKVARFLPDTVAVYKNNLFPLPQIFQMIQKEAKMDWSEVYKVFNAGNRLEVYCGAETAERVIATANHFGIDAQITGTCIARNEGDPQIVIETKECKVSY